VTCDKTPLLNIGAVTNLFVTGARDHENARDQVAPTSHVTYHVTSGPLEYHVTYHVTHHVIQLTLTRHMIYHVTHHVIQLTLTRHMIYHLTRTQAQYGSAHSLEHSMNVR